MKCKDFLWARTKIDHKHYIWCNFSQDFVISLNSTRDMRVRCCLRLIYCWKDPFMHLCFVFLHISFFLSFLFSPRPLNKVVSRTLQFSFSNSATPGPMHILLEICFKTENTSCTIPNQTSIIQILCPNQVFYFTGSCQISSNICKSTLSIYSSPKAMRNWAPARELAVACFPKAIISNKWYFSPSTLLKPLCLVINLSLSFSLSSYHTSWSNQIPNIKHLSWGSAYCLLVFSSNTHIINNNNNKK